MKVGTTRIVLMLFLETLLLPLLLAKAQQAAKVPQIGYLSPLSPSADSTRREGFRQRRRELGYVEGRNIIIEYRFTGVSAIKERGNL